MTARGAEAVTREASESASPSGDGGSKAGLKKWLRLGVGLVLLAVVAWRVDWGEFLGVVTNAKYGWIVLFAGVIVVDRCVMAGKWKYLLRHLGVPVTFHQALAHYFRGGAVGVAAQWQMGGDIARVVSLGKETGSRGVVVKSVVLERLVGAVGSGALASAGVLALMTVTSSQSLRLPLGVALAGSLSALVVPFLLQLEGLKLTVQRAIAKISGDWSSKLETVAASFWLDEGMRGPLFVFFLMTLGELLIPILSIIVLANAFSIPASPVEIAMVIPVTAFFSKLPISVESLGLREGLFVFFFGLVGVGAAEAFALALTVRVVEAMVMTSGAFALGLVPYSGPPAERAAALEDQQ